MSCAGLATDMTGVAGRIAAGIALLMVLSAGGSGLAAEPGGLAEFPREVWRDASQLPTTANAWWLLGGGTLSLAVAWFEDPEGAARALDGGATDVFTESGNIWGDMRVQIPLALGTWGVGHWTGSADVSGLGYDLSRGLLLTYGVTGALKAAFDRTRPNGDPLSFPSGHTASAFAVAGVVTRRHGGWAGGISLGLGVLTGLGRLEEKRHYASDVVAGATIGWIIGRNASREAGGDGWRLVAAGRTVAVSRRF